MLDVVQKEFDKKIYVTKINIIEHKDDLVRKYLDKKEIVNVEQKDKKGHITFPPKIPSLSILEFK